VIGVQQDDDVALVLDEALGLLDDHFRDLDMPRVGLVEGAGNDFPLDAALHLGDLLRPLVDQQHDEVALRVILGD
jgi:hypothetical protein